MVIIIAIVSERTGHITAIELKVDIGFKFKVTVWSLSAVEKGTRWVLLVFGITLVLVAKIFIFKIGTACFFLKLRVADHYSFIRFDA